MKADISNFLALTNSSDLGVYDVSCFNGKKGTHTAVTNGAMSKLLKAAILGGALYGGYQWGHHKVPATEEVAPPVSQTEYQTPVEQGIDAFKTTKPLWDSNLQTLLTGAGLVVGGPWALRKLRGKKNVSNGRVLTENKRFLPSVRNSDRTLGDILFDYRVDQQNKKSKKSLLSKWGKRIGYGLGAGALLGGIGYGAYKYLSKDDTDPYVKDIKEKGLGSAAKDWVKKFGEEKIRPLLKGAGGSSSEEYEVLQ